MRSILVISENRCTVRFIAERLRSREVLESMAGFDYLELEDGRDLIWADDFRLPGQRVLVGNRQPHPEEQFILLTRHGLFQRCVCVVD